MDAVVNPDISRCGQVSSKTPGNYAGLFDLVLCGCDVVIFVITTCMNEGRRPEHVGEKARALTDDT